MNILLAGGTGFIGQQLVSVFLKKDYRIFILTRHPESYNCTDHLTFISYDIDVNTLPTIDAVINLAGESLFGYWTKQKKNKILVSRISTTEKLVQMIQQMKIKPKVFLNASAVGYYGTSQEEIFTERTTTPGNDFLAHVVASWEKTAEKAAAIGIRTVFMRFGMVLGKAGALVQMSLPVHFFLGGRIGSGEQWMSWIHIDDVVQLIQFSLHEEISGPLNVTAPHPVRNKDFMRMLAKTLKRPYWFPTPAPIINLALGEMGQLVTKGQYVLPQKALDYGYNFLHENVQDSLKCLMAKND